MHGPSDQRRTAPQGHPGPNSGVPVVLPQRGRIRDPGLQTGVPLLEAHQKLVEPHRNIRNGHLGMRKRRSACMPRCLGPRRAETLLSAQGLASATRSSAGVDCRASLSRTDTDQASTARANTSRIRNRRATPTAPTREVLGHSSSSVEPRHPVCRRSIFSRQALQVDLSIRRLRPAGHPRNPLRVLVHETHEQENDDVPRAGRAARHPAGPRALRRTRQEQGRVAPTTPARASRRSGTVPRGRAAFFTPRAALSPLAGRPHRDEQTAAGHQTQAEPGPLCSLEGARDRER